MRLCLKRYEKMVNYEVYESYTQVFSQDIDEGEFSKIGVFDSLLDMYKMMCGVKVLTSLPSSKFSKIATYIKMAGGKQISAPEMDIIYKQTLSLFSEFDFYAFFYGCHQACLKAIKKEGFQGLIAMIDTFEKTKAKLKTETNRPSTSSGPSYLKPTSRAQTDANKSSTQIRPSSKPNTQTKIPKK